MNEGETGGATRSATIERTALLEPHDSREKVIETFNQAFSLWEETPETQLTPQEKWAHDSIRTAKEKTLDQGKDTFTNTFTNHHTGETFNQEEGIPVENLLDFLGKKLASLPEDSAERQKLINWGHILSRNSQFYTRLPHRLEPSRHCGRTHQEAHLISQDERATGTMNGDWFKAEESLMKRLELVLPATKPLPPEEARSEEEGNGEGTKVPPEPEKGEEEPLPTESKREGGEEEEIPLLTLEDVRREFVIGNRTVDVRKRAAELAEEQLRAEMRRGSALNPLNWFRKIRLRVAEEYYRQRYIDRATRAMLENNNSYLSMDVVQNAAIDANHRLTEEREAGRAKIEQIKTQAEAGLQFEGQRIQEAQVPVRELITQELIRPLVDQLRTGATVDEAQIQQRLGDFMIRHENHPDPQVRAQLQEFFGRGATQYGRVADYFATDLLEMSQMVAQDLNDNRYALEEISNHVKIILANTSWAAETQASFNLADRTAAWAERHRLSGTLINPATIGAAFSLGTFGALRMAGIGGRVAQFAVPGAGLLPGAVFAAVRRNYDLKVDMASHRRERTYAMEIPQEAHRREALERFAYNTASVDELLNGGGQEMPGGQARQSLSELLRQDLSVEQTGNREAVIRRLAEIKTRLDFSFREKVDLVTFAGREEVEQGRLNLLKGVIEARRVLQNAGMSEAEIAEAENRLSGDWNQHFTQNREQQDRAFAHYRLRNMAGAAVFGGVAGFGAGLLVQEGATLVERGVGLPAGQTVIEKGLGFFGLHVGETTPGAGGVAEVLKNLHQSGGQADLGGNLQANVSPDHSVSLMDKLTGQPIPDAPKITLEADGNLKVTGDVPQSLRHELQNSGFQINQGPDLVEPGRTITEQRSLLGPEGEWAKNATEIDHREWYSYDQPGSQGNELRLYTQKEGAAVILDMSKMELGYQKGLAPNPIDVGEVIKNKEAGWFFSLPSLPQEGMWVSDGADGKWDGLLRLDPTDTDPTHLIQTPSGPMQLGEFSKIVLNQEILQKLPDGNIATELTGRQDVFNLGQEGKMGFIEAGRIVDQEGVKVLQDFATIRGSAPVPETIEVVRETLPKTIPTFEIVPPPGEEIPAEMPETPPIIPIPFSPRHPLEPLKKPGEALPPEPTPKAPRKWPIPFRRQPSEQETPPPEGGDFAQLMAQGQAANRAGDREKARDYFAQAAKLNPDSEEVWLWKAATTENFEEALVYLRRALALNPARARARTTLEGLEASLTEGEGGGEPSPIPPPEPLAAEIVTGESEAVLEAKQAIFEQAGKRNVREVRGLASDVNVLISEEIRRGKNKLGETIEETKTGPHGTEYFVEGQVAYLPAKGRVVFVGDTHGDSVSTESIIEQVDFIENMEEGPKDMILVFLGDYVDRGINDVRNVELALSLKLRYPENVILMQGNHEEGGGLTPYDFPQSLEKRFGATGGKDLHAYYIRLFKDLPNVVITANGIVALHGGVPVGEQEIHNLTELKDNGSAFSQVRWNDPDSAIEEFTRSRGTEYKFGNGPFERFMQAVGGKVMVRGHEYPEEGYELFFGNRLATIFSSGGESPESGYRGRVRPKFAVFSLEKPLSEIIPEKHLREINYSSQLTSNQGSPSA